MVSSNMNKTATDLPPKAAEYARILREHMPELERDYGVASLALFGSYVRGEEQEGSDLDMLVDFSRPIGMFGLVATERYMSELVGVEVDLVTRPSLRRRIGRAILEEAVPL